MSVYRDMYSYGFLLPLLLSPLLLSLLQPSPEQGTAACIHIYICIYNSVLEEIYKYMYACDTYLSILKANFLHSSVDFDSRFAYTSASEADFYILVQFADLATSRRR